MQTLKIEIPNGFEVESFDASTGTVKFRAKPKNVMERIKTIEDVLNDNGISQEQFSKITQYDTPDEVAYNLLKLIVKSLNEGWIPDWDNSNQYKYVPWFNMSSSGVRFRAYGRWVATSHVGSRLCFKSSALAEYAGKTFEATYKKFMII